MPLHHFLLKFQEILSQLSKGNWKRKRAAGGYSGDGELGTLRYRERIYPAEDR